MVITYEGNNHDTVGELLRNDQGHNRELARNYEEITDDNSKTLVRKYKKGKNKRNNKGIVRMSYRNDAKQLHNF